MEVRIIQFLLLLFLVSFSYAQQEEGGNPLEPGRFPANEQKDKRLPPPLVEGRTEYDLKIISAENWEIKEKEVSGEKVNFEYRGYLAYADEVYGDLETSQFVLKGNLNVLSKDYVIRGETVFIDFRRRTFRLLEGDVDIRESFLQGKALSDVYASAGIVEGSEEDVTSHNCLLTSCNHDKPHFHIFARDVIVDPERKIVFKTLKVSVLNSTILTLPSVVIPLTAGSRDFIPQIGQSQDEGFFIKHRYTFPVSDNSGVWKTELTSKKGVSLGADYIYGPKGVENSITSMVNFLRADGVLSFMIGAKHKQSWAIGDLNFNHQSRRFSYLAGPQSTLHSTQVNFNLTRKQNTQTDFNFSRFENLSDTARNEQYSLQGSNRTQWSNSFTTKTNLTYTAFNSKAGSTSFERNVLDVRFETNYDMKQVSADIEYSRSVPIGSNINFFGGTDRIPTLTFRTDKSRLLPDEKFKSIPNFLSSLAIGHYYDQFLKVGVTRYAFDFRMNDSKRYSSGFSYDYDLGFFQGVYSDNTAQYTPKANIKTSHAIGNVLTVNLRYNYRRQHGFTPLAFDATGKYENASFDILAQIFNGFKIGGQTGYDFNRARDGKVAWQPPSVRMEFQQSDDFRVRALANYDTSTAIWRSVRADVLYKKGDTRIALSANYDGRQKKWGSINFFADALTIGRLKASLLLVYNGFLNRFDARHLSLTYDLHCAEAVLQIIENNVGFRPGREVFFFIRIKALPFDSPFGIGQSGNSATGGGIGW